MYTTNNQPKKQTMLMSVQPTMSPPSRPTDWAPIHWPFRDITQSVKSLPELRRFLCVAVRVDGQLRKKMRKKWLCGSTDEEASFAVPSTWSSLCRRGSNLLNKNMRWNWKGPKAGKKNEGKKHSPKNKKEYKVRKSASGQIRKDLFSVSVAAALKFTITSHAAG